MVLLNIRNNIKNYLFDKDYIVCTYEDYVYIFNYVYLNCFNDKRIIVRIPKKQLIVNGKNLSIIKITKEEILIKGAIKGIDLDDE